METAAAILTKLIIELRPDVQDRIRGIEAQHPEAMAAEIAVIFRQVLTALKRAKTMDYIPTAEQVTRALDHVFYEIQQLTLMDGKTSTDLSLNNAILESLLLHVRNLLDFFEHSGMPNDDVLSAHCRFPGSVITIDKQSRERLNKDLAHLTYSRTQRSPADRKWRRDQAVLPLLTRCRSFAEWVIENRTRYGERSKEDWQTLLASLAKIPKLAST